jgi:holo-[acyl-carrier protein] synthase
MSDDILLLPSTTTAGWQIALGVDIIEVARIKAALDRFEDRFLRRVYTLDELAIVGRNPLRLAGRFAVKEACSKALGTGIGAANWTDIACLSDTKGKPVLHLYGGAAQIARALGWQTVDVSISTTHQFAVAAVVALGEEH